MSKSVANSQSLTISIQELLTEKSSIKKVIRKNKLPTPIKFEAQNTFGFLRSPKKEKARTTQTDIKKI